MSWTVFPRIYTNLQSKGNFLRNEKSLPKYLIHEKFKMSAFFISEITTLKMETFFKFYLIFKGPPFQYHKVRHPKKWDSIFNGP